MLLRALHAVRLPSLALTGLLVGLLAVACSDTGPIFPASLTLDDWVLAPASVDPRSDTAPQLTDRLASFGLGPGQGRSTLRAGHEWGVGQTYLLGFDIRVDPGAIGATPVTVSRLVRGGKPETDLLSVRLDSRRGVTVLGRGCIPASQLGQWHSVEVRIALADDDSGFLEVFCDRRPIWAQSRLRTTLPPVCRLAQGCVTPVSRPARFEWHVGLISERPATRPLRLQMRRIFYHRLFVIPNRVGAL